MLEPAARRGGINGRSKGGLGHSPEALKQGMIDDRRELAAEGDVAVDGISDDS
jgi:hypothetical protein